MFFFTLLLCLFTTLYLHDFFIFTSCKENDLKIMLLFTISKKQVPLRYLKSNDTLIVPKVIFQVLINFDIMQGSLQICGHTKGIPIMSYCSKLQL